MVKAAKTLGMTLLGIIYNAAALAQSHRQNPTTLTQQSRVMSDQMLSVGGWGWLYKHVYRTFPVAGP